MIHYLRNKNNETVVDVEVYMSQEAKGFVELHSFVDIMGYSKVLLDNLHKQEELMKDFYLIQKIKCLIGEEQQKEPANLDRTNNMVKAILVSVGNRCDLVYVED